MQTPFTSAGFTPDAAFTSAAERFFELLKTFGMPAATGTPGQRPDWSSLAGPLAGQFEQWLRMSQSAGPWFSAPGAGAPGAAGASAAATPAWSFGPLPLGPGVAPPADAQRTFELLGRLAQLQGQLAAHWSEVAGTAARCFVARVGASPGGASAAGSALKLYEQWVDCAEEAYAATVHREDFCRLQAELANTAAALLVEQRRHAETLVRAFGLPTRNEMDALYAQLKELRAQLAQLAEAPRAPGTSGSAARIAPAPRSAGTARTKAATPRARARPSRSRRPRA